VPAVGAVVVAQPVAGVADVPQPGAQELGGIAQVQIVPGEFDPVDLPERLLGEPVDS
jgi:hypothetical protein